MKISDFKGEKAIDFIGDIIEPASKIFSDDVVRSLFTPEKNSEKKTKAAVTKHICKNYPAETIEILAALEEVEPEKYEGNPVTIAMQVFEILNDPDLMSVFISSEQKTEKKSSGSVAANTEGTISEDSFDSMLADLAALKEKNCTESM